MKILVVDDEKDIEGLFLQRFRREIKEGLYQFAFAFSGEEALRFMQDKPHEAVLILSDINMPGMSGLQLLENIRKEYEMPPPVIYMITAYGDEASYQQAMRLGANDFLTKPLDFNSLKDKLKSFE